MGVGERLGGGDGGLGRRLLPVPGEGRGPVSKVEVMVASPRLPTSRDWTPTFAGEGIKYSGCIAQMTMEMPDRRIVWAA